VTGVGKASEAMGLKVKANIYDNGLDATYKDPVLGVEHNVKTKLKSSGGDFGGKGSAEMRKDGIRLAGASFSVDSKGISGNISAGPSVCSPWVHIKSSSDVGKIIKALLDAITSPAKGIRDAIEKVTGGAIDNLLDNTLQFVLQASLGCSFAVLQRSVLKNDTIKMYVQVGLSIEEGIGACLKLGQEEEYVINDKKQTFKMFAEGGKLACFGLTAAYGYANGKLFDGSTIGVLYSASGVISGVGVSVSVIVTTNVKKLANETYNDVIKKCL